MPESNIQPSVTPLQDKVLTLADKQSKIESCSLLMSRKGVSKENAFALSSANISNFKNHAEVEAFEKLLSEIDRSFVGVTSSAGKKKHKHSYTLLVLNGGDTLVGVTTDTTGDEQHVHNINLRLDYKIIAIESYTNYNYGESMKDENEPHQHIFKANIEKISNETPSTWVYFNENGKVKNGDVKKFLFSETAEKQEKITNYAISAELTSDSKGHYSFSNNRQASIVLSRVAQLSQAPTWFRGSIDSLQATVVDSVIKVFGEIDFTNTSDSYVSEMVMNLAAKKKLNPKAKVRNKKDPIFPAGSKDVNDNKDHFPTATKAQTSNSLARAAQYDKAPAWYKGTLKQLLRKVRAAVKKKYPSIKVKGLSEYYAIRLKEEKDVYFLYLLTENDDAAKNDCSIYFKECADARVDLVKFRVNHDDETCQFSEIGNIILYDIAKDIKLSTSNKVVLSEKDNAGNVVIEILREGNYNHEIYGNFTVSNDLIQEMIKNFNDDVLDREVAFDMNHLVDLPAAAWVKKLSTSKKVIKGENRVILNAHVKPTTIGKEAIDSKLFKYFSSEYTENFTDKETGKEYGAVLKGGGLTNRPWIPGLAPIQLSEIKDGICILSNT